MAEALRRLLWLVPVTAVGAVALFVLLGSLPQVSRRNNLALVYNPAPQSARQAARRALGDLIAGRPGAEERLQELGGAALPHLLPELPALRPTERRRVSEALWPVAERMGLIGDMTWNQTPQSPGSFSADDKLLFWDRYHEEHSLDFRPLVVERLVRRLGDRHLGLRRADLLALDTYALPALVAQLGRVAAPQDVTRVHLLSQVIDRVTAEPLGVPKEATLEQARLGATRIREYWARRGHQWTQLNRFERLVARFSQTELYVWISSMARQAAGIDASPLASRAARVTGSSGPRIALLLGGSLLVAPLLVGIFQLLTFRHRKYAVRRLGIRFAFSAVLCFFVPALVTRAPTYPASAGALCLIAGAVSAIYLLTRELSDRIDWRTHAVLVRRRRLSQIAAVSRWLAPSLPTYAPLVTAESALWLCCIEVSGGFSGLGSETVRAFNEGDLNWLMFVSLALGVATGTVQVLADLALGTATWRRGET